MFKSFKHHVAALQLRDSTFKTLRERNVNSHQDGGKRERGLLDSEDPKHALSCREALFVVIYALFQG